MNNWRNAIKAGIREGEPYAFNEVFARIKLDQNESPYDVPDTLKQEIAEKVCKRSWNRYASITGEPLRKALSTYLDIPVNRIVVGVGSDDMLHTTMGLVLGKDKTVLYVVPTFHMYRINAICFEANQKVLQMLPDFSFPVDEMIETIKSERIHLVVLASPNNPTGNSIDFSALEEIAKSTDGLVIVDEAYYEFSGKTALGLQNKYKNLVIIRTFSKAFCLAGVRIGYILADPEIVNYAHKVKMPFNLNIFSETAAITLLENPGILQRNIERIAHNKRELFEELQKIPAIKVFPSETNFYIIDVGKSGKKVAEQFADAGIAVRDISRFPMLENYIRISVGTGEENEKLIQTMQDICDGVTNG